MLFTSYVFFFCCLKAESDSFFCCFKFLIKGVSRALVDNSRTLRLPTHLHERLGLIRNAKLRLQEKGVTPSIDVSIFFNISTILALSSLSTCISCVYIYCCFQRIAESLNMSQKKVRNATEVLFYFKKKNM